MLTIDQLYNRYDVLCDICSDLRSEEEDDDMMQTTISMLENAICYLERCIENNELKIREGKSTIMKVKIDRGAYMPERARSADAGLDLKSAEYQVIPQYEMRKIKTGVHVELPKGTVGMIKTRSSVNALGLQCEGVIDEGYTGEIMVVMQNHTDKIALIQPGEKIAQLVILPVIRPEIELVDELEETERGDKGFGSSGK